MTTSFWEIQRRARRQTAIYLSLFAVLTIVAACVVELGLRTFASDQYNPPTPLAGGLFLAVTFLVAFGQYLCFKGSGGKYVPLSMGARLANRAADIREQELLNIVEEIAIASSLPVPPVYIINAEAINAFAAGLATKDAVIAVTTGALNQLNRDEMQAVIAHEFGHIANGDMLIGLRLAAMVMGFYFVIYMSLRILQFTSYRRSSNNKGANPVLVIALCLLIAGAFTWLFGSILKAAVSRQREYLADASSVQFTRNPNGLIAALEKIEEEQTHDMPKTGISYSHLYLDDRSSFFSLFATHPPLNKRIQRLQSLTK